MSADVIARLNAALEGRYRLERELGQGGMATVFLADDIRHQRKVAIKVLRPDLAAVLGAERFLTEIRTTANLQHPHILPLHDSGEADGFLFFVMPYIEGETLRDRLDREKQLPVEEAVGISVAIASALQAAHEQGVFHRDIKPANILMSRGQPLVADFGIALAVSEAGGNRLTETGLSVGTPFYMSPEQATGDREIGPQSDVYALGCMLYEMLLGDPPYVGSTAQAVLGKILTETPKAPTAVRAVVPKNVEGAVLKSLEKLPADRFRNAADFARALGDPSFRWGAEAEVAGVGGRAPGIWRPLAIAMTVVAAGATGFAVWGGPDAPALPLYVGLDPPPGSFLSIGNGVNLDIAPDGSAVVFAARIGVDDALWIRRLDAFEPARIEGTEGARVPRFSPDGSSVAYVVDGALRTARFNGAPPRTLMQAGVSSGGGGLSWGDDGFIYFEAGPGFQRIPEGGGAAEDLCSEATSSGFAWPDVLPDGTGALYTATGAGQNPSFANLGFLDFSTCETTTLLTGTMVRFTPPGDLVYATSAGQILSVPFDPGKREITGSPTPLLEGIQVNSGSASYFATSDNGALVYATGGVEDRPYPIVWGAEGPLERYADVGNGGILRDPAVSPDGRRVAVSFYSMENGRRGIWILDLQEGTFAPLTFDPLDTDPFWSPDGARVGFARNREETELWWTPSDFSGEAEPIQIAEAGQEVIEGRLTPDGTAVVYLGVSEEGRALMWAPLDGQGEPRRLADVDDPRDIDLSPDGNWVALTSSVTGRPEVYVAPVTTPGGRRQVSVSGASQPQWAPTGDRLYYWSYDGEIWYAEVTTTPDFAVTGGRFLFAGNEDLYSAFDVLNDGRTLLTLSQNPDSPEGSRLRFVTDWRKVFLGDEGR